MSLHPQLPQSHPFPVYFIGLNAARFLSIVSLLLVFSSTIVVMVNNIKAVNSFEDAKLSAESDEDIEDLLDCEYIYGSTVPNQAAGVFWAIVASLLILFQVTILFLSEISWPMSFFDRFFPVLGSQFGLGALGIFQALIATQVLSHHVDDFTLVAAFFLFSVACVNMLLGLVFRAGAKEKRSIRGWRAGHTQKELKIGRPVFVSTDGSPAPTYVSHPMAGEDPFRSHSWAEKGGYTAERSDSWRSNMGFGRQAEKAAGLRGFHLQAPGETLPRYITPIRAPSSHHTHGRTRSGGSVSTASSVTSPSQHEARQEQLHNAILEHTSPRGRREERSRSRSRSPGRTVTPVFKSSNAAL